MLAAVQRGDAKNLAELMRQDPGFDVNMEQDGGGFTLLHNACLESHRSPVIPLLLAHPDVSVNAKSRYAGFTPFYCACRYGHHSCVREMLKDSRVKLYKPDNDGRTPLYGAACFCHIDVIRWWIASWREMDLGRPGDILKTDVIGGAKMYGPPGVVTLLERFKENPVKTRHAVRLELGDELAAEMFALVVFVSDGLLQVNDTATPSPATKFFNIARSLPLELQMVLCVPSLGGIRQGYYSRQGERGGIQGTGKEILVIRP